MATSKIRNENVFYKNFSFDGTPNSNGWVITNVPLDTYIPIAVYDANRDGWDFVFSKYVQKSTVYWCVHILNATSSSGNFKGDIVAIQR